MTLSESDYQRIVIARLRDYHDWSPKVAQYYADRTGYMRDKISHLPEPLTELKKAALRRVSSGYLKSLESGKLDPKLMGPFYEALDKFISYKDFVEVKSIQFLVECGTLEVNTLRTKLAELKPVSAFDELAKKPEERDVSAGTLIMTAYKRVGLGDLEKEYEGGKIQIDDVLGRAQASVKEWCAVLKVPDNDTETLSPFMVVNIEGIAAANMQFLNRLGGIQPRSQQ